MKPFTILKECGMLNTQWYIPQYKCLRREWFKGKRNNDAYKLGILIVRNKGGILC